MLIVYEVYSDDEVDIMNLTTKQIQHYTKDALKGVDVYGLSQGNYIHSYNIVEFEYEPEARAYKQEHNISGTIKDVNGLYVLLYKKDKVIDVEYYVYSEKGKERSYVAEKGYSGYRQGAKVFTKKEAQKTALIMTRNSRTGTHWYVERIVQRYR